VTDRETALRRYLRLCLRLPAIVALTFVLYGVRLAGGLARPVAPGLDRAAWAATYRLWGRALMGLFGARVVVRGAPPEPPFVLTANHLSYVDVLALCSIQPGVFIAKSEIASWPVLGPMFRGMHVHFINRESLRDVVRVQREMDELLDDGFGIYVFPEGGVAQSCQVETFRGALLHHAARDGRPVHYAAVTYRGLPDGPHARDLVAWLDGTTFMDHFLRLNSARGFVAEVTFGEEPVTAPDRKVLAAELESKVRRLYTPLA
jgi:1-acyl-sn-glycerol-3-phosphate acyltransferase